jgi:hypothetical protein
MHLYPGMCFIFIKANYKDRWSIKVKQKIFSSYFLRSFRTISGPGKRQTLTEKRPAHSHLIRVMTTAVKVLYDANLKFYINIYNFYSMRMNLNYEHYRRAKNIFIFIRNYKTNRD